MSGASVSHHSHPHPHVHDSHSDYVQYPAPISPSRSPSTSPTSTSSSSSASSSSCSSSSSSLSGSPASATNGILSAAASNMFGTQGFVSAQSDDRCNTVSAVNATNQLYHVFHELKYPFLHRQYGAPVIWRLTGVNHGASIYFKSSSDSLDSLITHLSIFVPLSPSLVPSSSSGFSSLVLQSGSAFFSSSIGESIKLERCPKPNPKFRGYIRFILQRTPHQEDFKSLLQKQRAKWKNHSKNFSTIKAMKGEKETKEHLQPVVLILTDEKTEKEAEKDERKAKYTDLKEKIGEEKTNESAVNGDSTSNNSGAASLKFAGGIVRQCIFCFYTASKPAEVERLEGGDDDEQREKRREDKGKENITPTRAVKEEILGGNGPTANSSSSGSISSSASSTSPFAVPLPLDREKRNHHDRSPSPRAGRRRSDKAKRVKDNAGKSSATGPDRSSPAATRRRSSSRTKKTMSPPALTPPAVAAAPGLAPSLASSFSSALSFSSPGTAVSASTATSTSSLLSVSSLANALPLEPSQGSSHASRTSFSTSPPLSTVATVSGDLFFNLEPSSVLLTQPHLWSLSTPAIDFDTTYFTFTHRHSSTSSRQSFPDLLSTPFSRLSTNPSANISPFIAKISGPVQCDIVGLPVERICPETEMETESDTLVKEENSSETTKPAVPQLYHFVTIVFFPADRLMRNILMTAMHNPVALHAMLSDPIPVGVELRYGQTLLNNGTLIIKPAAQHLPIQTHNAASIQPHSQFNSQELIFHNQQQSQSLAGFQPQPMQRTTNPFLSPQVLARPFQSPPPDLASASAAASASSSTTYTLHDMTLPPTYLAFDSHTSPTLSDGLSSLSISNPSASSPAVTSASSTLSSTHFISPSEYLNPSHSNPPTPLPNLQAVGGDFDGIALDYFQFGNNHTFAPFQSPLHGNDSADDSIEVQMAATLHLNDETGAASSSGAHHMKP